MRVLLVVHGFPPRERSGVENHVAELARAVAAAPSSLEVHVFTREQDRSREHHAVREEFRDGVRVFFANDVRPARPGRLARDELLPRGMDAVFREVLDRVRPDVVHFHHLHKLGLGLPAVAARAGCPTLYTVHDFFPWTSAYTRLAPDLTPLATDEPEKLARLDLARAWLDRRAPPGDHHGFVDVRELDERARVELRALLHGDPAELGAAGVTRAELESAVRERRDLELRRREAFSRFDRMLAPTEGLARELRTARFSGSASEEDVAVDAYGVDERWIEALAAVGAPTRGPRLRVGFVGSIVRHKGLDVLLEAFEVDPELAATCELHVSGSSQDRAYSAAMEARAERVGAHWHGAFEHADVARCFQRFDVLVVPSVWSEVAPFVIREAFAARRPVIASRTDALAESIRDGVDGLLYTTGDARELAGALRRLAREPGLLERLVDATRSPRTLADQAHGLVAHYADLAARGPRVRAPSLDLAHLAPFAARHARLAAMSAADLSDEVFHGLDLLAQDLLGADAKPAQLVRSALLARSVLPKTLEALERERDWFAGRVAAAEERDGSRGDETAWLERTLLARTRAVEALEAELRSASRALDASARETAWLRGLLAERDRERDELLAAKVSLAREAAWREETLAARERELAWRRETAFGLEGELTKARGDRDAAQAALREAQAALTDRSDARAVLTAELAWREETLAERERELAWRKEVLAAREAELDAVARARDESRAEAAASAAERARLARELDLARARLDDERRARLEAEGEGARLREGRLAREHELIELEARMAALRLDSEARVHELAEMQEEHMELESVLAWRQEEMQTVGRELGRLRYAFVAGPLRDRARAWIRGEPPKAPKAPKAVDIGADPATSPRGDRS